MKMILKIVIVLLLFFLVNKLLRYEPFEEKLYIALAISAVVAVILFYRRKVSEKRTVLAAANNTKAIFPGGIVQFTVLILALVISFGIPLLFAYSLVVAQGLAVTGAGMIFGISALFSVGSSVTVLPLTTFFYLKSTGYPDKKVYVRLVIMEIVYILLAFCIYNFPRIMLFFR